MQQAVQQMVDNPLTSLKSLLLLDLKLEVEILERRAMILQKLANGFGLYGGLGDWKIYQNCLEAIKPRIEELNITIKMLEGS